MTDKEELLLTYRFQDGRVYGYTSALVIELSGADDQGTYLITECHIERDELIKWLGVKESDT